MERGVERDGILYAATKKVYLARRVDQHADGIRLQFGGAIMATRTAVFHIGRCGSTVLSQMLDATPGIRADSEVFNIAYGERLKTEPDLHVEVFAEQLFTQRTGSVAQIA